MQYKLLIIFIIILPLSGCASLDGQDFAEIGTEIALNLLTGENFLEKGENGVFRGRNDDYVEVWDAKDSASRRDVRERQAISDMLDSIEEGKDYVLLPTGELYPVGSDTSWRDPGNT